MLTSKKATSWRGFFVSPGLVPHLVCSFSLAVVVKMIRCEQVQGHEDGEEVQGSKAGEQRRQ